MKIVLKGVRRLFTKGPRDTARWVRYHLYERYREWSLGIETAGSAEWKESLHDPVLHVYEPLSYEAINAALAGLEINPGEDVLLDYGCGKGRIVTVAATYPFQRVIGIELLPELAAIARENLRRTERRLSCPAAEVITADATAWDVPPEVTVIFLFNPFRGEVLRKVQQRIYRSLVGHPRNLTIIYMNPIADEDAFATCEWLMPKRTLPTMWTSMRLVIYESAIRATPSEATEGSVTG